LPGRWSAALRPTRANEIDGFAITFTLSRTSSRAKSGKRLGSPSPDLVDVLYVSKNHTVKCSRFIHKMVGCYALTLGLQWATAMRRERRARERDGTSSRRATMRIPTKSAVDSERSRPPVPIEAGQGFR